MKVIMTGGGTGGHIYPAIAIADKIKEMQEDAEILFVGTKRGLETELVPKNGYPLEFVTVSGFNRKNPLKNVRTAKDLVKGIKEADAIIEKFRPDVVIGTGGYVCGPVVRSAKKHGVHCFIHEQNAFPGMTNKILQNYVDKVFISFDAAAEYFRKKNKLILTGNPVRKQFFEADYKECRQKLGIEDDRFVLLCFGGSRGAERINEAMLRVLEKYNGSDKMEIYFVTGKVHFDEVKEKTSYIASELADNIHILPYIDNMDVYLGACDLVISRAGALTVSEITVCRKPSIMIPSPYVTGNHQYFNAKAVADVGGAILTEEKYLTNEILLSDIETMLTNPEKRQKMGLDAAKAAPGNATEIIYREVMKALGK
ncbi:MAG: undecaprenyldiphospho-muramoylpentapeptide beta-N-acetylglucosaminyltransferase [Clostridia bacterium]|nr:undecaprenyldiphospho-muramoylpentapeptide beta-N-acetylglucosaminyltransferase [Clostridia bacterium]